MSYVLFSIVYLRCAFSSHRCFTTTKAVSCSLIAKRQHTTIQSTGKQEKKRGAVSYPSLLTYAIKKIIDKKEAAQEKNMPVIIHISLPGLVPDSLRPIFPQDETPKKGQQNKTNHSFDNAERLVAQTRVPSLWVRSSGKDASFKPSLYLRHRISSYSMRSEEHTSELQSHS